MPQIRRERRPTARRPAAVTPRIPTLIRPVSIRAIKVQQQMRLPGDRVVPVCCGALNARLDHGRVAAGPGPRAEEPRGGDLYEDRLFGFVLHEAEEGVRVGAVDGQDGQVDDVGGGFVDEGLRGRERFEVAGVGIANTDIGGGAGVAGVGGWVLDSGEWVSSERWLAVCGVLWSYKLGCPVDEVLPWYRQSVHGARPWLQDSWNTFRRVPEGLWGPNHASGGVFHVDKPLISPVEEIGAFPDKDPPRPSPLCRIPCCLSSCQEADDTAALSSTHLPNI